MLLARALFSGLWPSLSSGREERRREGERVHLFHVMSFCEVEEGLSPRRGWRAGRNEEQMETNLQTNGRNGSHYRVDRGAKSIVLL